MPELPDEALYDQVYLTARTLLDMETMRIQISNRMEKAKKEGVLDFWREGGVFPGQVAVEGMKKLEHDLDLELTRLMRTWFMRDWIEGQKGVGLLSVGLLLGITGPLDNFATVSKLWKYLGLAVNEDGLTQKKAKGQLVDFSPMGRVICHRIGDTIVKVGAGGPYREAYDRKKAEYLARPRIGTSECPMGREHRDKNKKVYPCIHEKDGKEISAHIHAAAMRYAVKCFLRDFWEEWHRRRAKPPLMPAENMPASAAAD